LPCPARGVQPHKVRYTPLCAIDMQNALPVQAGRLTMS